MKRVMLLTIVFVILLTSSGCILLKGFEPDRIVKHPDASCLILSYNSDWVQVAIYSEADNRLLDYGWVPIEDFIGWTLHKFDWESFLDSRID